MPVVHPIAPLFSENSHTLILGSFPSVASRKQVFYYAHPQNRFWRVLAALYGESLPETVEEKKKLILSHGLALWDVIASCEIVGSSDSSIRSVKPNDLSVIMNKCTIKHIYVNGKTAARFYARYQSALPPAVCLPSTSAANAAWQFHDLLDAWRVIRDPL